MKNFSSISLLVGSCLIGCVTPQKVDDASHLSIEEKLLIVENFVAAAKGKEQGPVNIDVQGLYDISEGDAGSEYFLVQSRQSKSDRVPVLIQMPHVFHDKGTLPIGLRLCFLLAAEECIWNKRHRREIDFAHPNRPTAYDEHFRKWLAKHPKSIVIQLHGYATEKRKTKNAQNADVILSHSRSQKAPKMELSKFQNISGMNMKIFGTDVFELGGLTNAQRKLTESSLHGQHHFFHLEMSEHFRKRLLNERSVKPLLDLVEGLRLAI